MDALASKTRSRHPRHRSKSDVPNPVSAIRSAFRRVLPKTFVHAKSFHALAMDFYATSMGLVAGVCIDNFGLTYLETAMLALELSNAVDTSSVLLLLSQATSQMLVLHIDILASRMDKFPSDLTLFVERMERKVISRPARDYDHFKVPFDCLKTFLRCSTRQCVQTSEFGWSPIEAEHMMGPLTAWLLEHPVVFFDSTLNDLTPDEEINQSSYQSWHLRIGFEGYEPRHDHSFELGSIPACLFEKQHQKSIHDAAPDLSPDMAAIQSRIQQTMFDRLNGNFGNQVWADVQVKWS